MVFNGSHLNIPETESRWNIPFDATSNLSTQTICRKNSSPKIVSTLEHVCQRSNTRAIDWLTKLIATRSAGLWPT